MFSTTRPFAGVVALLLLSLALASGSHAANERVSRYYDDGLARFEKKDFPGAIIQLKNALQEDPGSLAANLLIGNAYLANLQPADAQNAFEKALRLGADRSEIAIPLAESLLVQGRGKDLLTRFPPESVSGTKRIELLVLRGQAFRQEGDDAAAVRSFEEAIALDPQSISAKLSLADLRAQRGSIAEAIRLADDAIRIAPQNAAGIYVKGTIVQASGDAAGALNAYDQAIAIDPKAPDARLARATLLMDLGRDEAAKTDLEFLNREHPREPRANYLRAVYLSRKGDAAGAQAALLAMSQLLDPVPIEVLKARTPEMLLLAGLAYHGLGSSEKAVGYLEQFLTVQPSHVGARKVLGTLLLERRDAVSAIKVLEPAVRLAPKDSQALALLASAYLARGRTREASRYLEQSLALGGATPGIQATLGFSLLQGGQQQAGQRNLEQAFEKDPSLENVGVALTLLYIRQGATDRAVKTAERMVRQYPTNLAVLNLLGVAKAAVGDASGARAAYLKAIEKDRSFTPAQLNLVRLDVAEGKYSEGRDRLAELHKARPKDGQVMLEFGRLEDRAGRLGEAVRWLEKLRGIEPRNLPGSLTLVDVYLRIGDAGKALEVARSMEPYGPENLDVLSSIAMALLANGDLKGAQATLARMTIIANFDAPSQHRIATLQLRANNADGASYSLDKALAGNPAFMPARVLKVEVDLMRDQMDRAESGATAVLRENPGKAVGHRLLADVAFRRGKYGEALTGYRAALEKEPTTAHALAVYRAMVPVDGQAKAIVFLESWRKGHPSDPVVSQVLAEAYLRAGDLDMARRQFEAILAERGETPGVLNNLATIASRQGDEKAMDFARRAYKLAPNDAYVLDTLGWLSVQRGSMDVGLKYLREARLRAPANPEIRYHFAAALAKSGRREDARKELEPVMVSRTAFAELEDARKLSRELSRTQ